MPVEDRKDTIAFIICVNNELYFEECIVQEHDKCH